VFFPNKAIDIMETLSVTDKLYNGQDFGSLLAWRWDRSRWRPVHVDEAALIFVRGM